MIADGTAIPAIDLEGLLAAHRKAKAAMTVVAHREPSHGGGEQLLSPGGIYVFERSVCDQIPETGFQDIKENLIPRLYRSGEHVITYTSEGACPRVLNAQTYLAVSQWMVERLAEFPDALDGYIAFGYTLAHPSVRIARSARLVGPILIGPSAKIMSGATIVGPAVIGEGCTVGAGALVSRSVTWNRSIIGQEAVVDQCIVAHDAVVESKEQIFNALEVPNGRRGRAALDEVVEKSEQLEPLPAIVYPKPVLR